MNENSSNGSHLVKFLFIFFYKLWQLILDFIRTFYLKFLFKKLGKGSYISRNVSIGRFSNIEIGKHVSINQGCNLYGDFGIIIGDYSKLSPYVQLYSANYIYNKHKHIGESGVRGQQIIIGKNVWIGASSIVLSGVKIGDNSIIGAMSLVNKNIPSGEMWAGNPIKFIKRIN